MGVVLRVLARVLFVVLFVGSGVNKITEPQATASYLNASYGPFHKWAASLVVVQKLNAVIPPEVQPHLALAQEYLTPSFVQDHSVTLITYIGYFQIVASVLVILGVPLAGFALFEFTLATIAIIHNPFVNPLTFHAEFVNALLNLAIAGVALFIASSPTEKSCNITATKCQTQTPSKVNSEKKPSISKPPSKGRK